jgi:capsule assembly protein Wzi
MIRSALLITILICSSARLGSQATPRVAPTERVYRDIERLAAAGLIDTLILGPRPFSEGEVARLLSEARRNLERRPSARAWAERTIARDLARYARSTVRVYDRATFEATELDSPYRGIPSDANGEIDAVINPLAANHSARPTADGITASLETSHSLTLGSHLAAMINPRFTAWSVRGDGDGSNVVLQSAAANVLFGNVAIDVGRDHAIFGQSPSGGLLLSANAPTLDLVRISNDVPAALPWVFRFLGPARGTLFVADLGDTRQIHPRAKLAGYHIAFLPHPQFEFGAEVLDAMGGRGGQPASFGDRIVDAIPLIDAIFRSGTDFQFSNKLAGIDFRWRMPSWRGFELYGEGAADDFDIRRLRSTLLEDSGYLVGVSLACLTECGRLGIRGEYHQTGIRYYTHFDYPLSARGALLGDPLGPRAVAGYLTLDGESARAGYFAIEAAFESRSGNQYGSATTGANTVGFHFVRTAVHPAEKRARAFVTWAPDARDGRLELRLSAGAERVSNFGFAAGSDRTNWLARTALVVRP